MFSKSDRKKFSIQKALENSQAAQSGLAKKQFAVECEKIERITGPVVFWNSKFSHTGITAYKVFENCNRKVHHNSLSNLLNVMSCYQEDINYYVKEFRACASDEARMRINDAAVAELSSTDYATFLLNTRQKHSLSPLQSRKVKRYASKLAYYTQTRHFTSKKSGKYSMKVSFLTLTCPESTTEKQSLSAFNHFLDYLRRTANCVYVWKKELGETNGKLHYHLMLNNFVPFYIISWKWKRLLINEGVEWPCRSDGTHTDSHYRLELPRSKKLIGSYIAKYMSKAFDLPLGFGAVAGHSAILDELKEIVMLMDDVPDDELKEIVKHSKVIQGDYMSFICCDLLRCSRIAPRIHALFESQYVEFSTKITLTQKFNAV